MFCRMTPLNALFLLIVLSSIFPAAGSQARATQTSEPLKLLENLKALDLLYTSGLTATGTNWRVSRYPDVPVQKLRWKLTIQGERYALSEESIEVLERKTDQAPMPFENTLPGMMMKRVVYLGPERTGHHFIFGDVLAPGRTPKLEENMVSGQVLLHAPDSDYFIMAKIQYLWSLGRGYSNYIEDIAEITAGEDGTIRATAEGHGPNGNRGQWQLQISPEAMYMVRAATFRTYTPQGKPSDTADISVTTSGVKWVASRCVPEQAEFSAFGQSANRPATVEMVSAEPDTAFLEQANQFLDPPYAVPTSWGNLAYDPPLNRFFQPEELFESSDDVLWETFKSSASASGRLERQPTAPASISPMDHNAPAAGPPDGRSRPPDRTGGSALGTHALEGWLLAPVPAVLALLGSVLLGALYLQRRTRNKEN